MIRQKLYFKFSKPQKRFPAKDAVALSFLNQQGVFETMRVYRGSVLRLADHMRRFQASAKTLGLTLPWKAGPLAKWIKDRLRESKFGEALVRVHAVSQAEDGAALTLLIRSIRPIPRGFYTRGVSVETTAVRKDCLRASHPQAKSNQYTGAIDAVTLKRLEGSFETFFLNQEGWVTEGAISNFLIIKKGRIFTPPSSCGILMGVTRSLVLEAAERIGILFVEKPITQHDIYTADEAVLTTTLSEIVPIVEWDKRRIGDGKPGCHTKRLTAEFRKMIHEAHTNSSD